ncbi:MAG: hypothetical protein Fur0039_12760 [Rhodocyclaceae bacterium]
MILALLATGPYPVGDGNRAEMPRRRSAAAPQPCSRGCGGNDPARRRSVPDCQTIGFQRRLDLAMRFPALAVMLFEGETRVCAAKMELIRRYAAQAGQPRPAACSEHFGACTRVCPN